MMTIMLHKISHFIVLLSFSGILFTQLLTVNAQSCRFPGSPAHCTVTFSDKNLENGTVASYYCERGFELLGPSRRICHKGTWTPEGIPFCVLNVAAGKAPMQISTDGIGIPQKAIDGSTSSFFSTETCSLTKEERTPWWYVNLLEPYMVQLVRLDFGKACCEKRKPATIVVRVGNNRPDLGTNPICNRFTGELEVGQPLFLPCNPPMPGAFVSVHLEVDVPSTLSICEAFVYTDQALPIERCPSFRDQPPGASASYNGKCYIFYNRHPLNFAKALSFCQSRGGTLISESNPALQGFISWELWRRHRSDVSSQYWIGAVRDNHDKNLWKWITDEEVTVSFWNQPGGNENCARYDGSKGWLWSDTNCNAPLNFICQHQPTECGRPEQPPNSTMLASRGFEVGATVTYKCDTEHLLVGPASRTCLKTGFYDEFPPICKYIECGIPASIPHGGYELVNGSVGYLSVVKYGCNEGYEMHGRAYLTCDIDERWNGPPPKCEIIECDTLPANYYNTIISTPNGTYYGSKAEIACPKGYRLSGPNTITCLKTGQWSQTIPRCLKIESSTITTLITTNVPITPSIQPSRPTITTTTRKVVSSTEPYRNKNDDDTLETLNIVPGTVLEEFPPKRTVRPSVVVHNHDDKHQADKKTPISSVEASPKKKNLTDIPSAVHPQENEIVNSVNIRNGQTPQANIPSLLDHESKESHTAKLNLGAIVALGAFGGFVLLAAIISTIVLLVRRNQTKHHYRRRASPDCNTVASFDSSTSGSRNGLNRYYRQAWENLHESASKASSQNPLRRNDTLDAPQLDRSRENIHRSRDNVERALRDYGRDHLGLRDGSEMVISDVCVKEKKRHHHHHHKTNHRNEFKDPSLIGNSRHEIRHSRDQY